LRPFLSLDTSPIELRHGKRHLVADVLIQNAQKNDRQRSESNVDQENIRVFVQVCAVEISVDLVPEQGKSPHNILEKKKEKKKPGQHS
jgi:hypothetical protein